MQDHAILLVEIAVSMLPSAPLNVASLNMVARGIIKKMRKEIMLVRIT